MIRQLFSRYPLEPFIGSITGILLGWGLFGLLFGALLGYFGRVLRLMIETDSEEEIDSETEENPRLLEAYRVLGVQPETDIGEVRRVYRRLAASFHPDGMTVLDGSQQKEAEEAFLRIRSAWELVARERGVQP